MLDGTYGQRLNRVWEFLGRGIARTGASPNQVTVAGMLLVAASAAAYLWHRNSAVLGACLIVSFCFDGLDGAVARLTNRSSRYGGYLDAVIDRYQEMLVLAAIAHVRDLWPAAFLVITGGLVTSYNKARASMEIPINNMDWPDLIERMERLVILIALLLLDGIWPTIPYTHLPLLGSGLVLLGVAAHFTGVQRFFRARGRIRRAEGHAGAG